MSDKQADCGIKRADPPRPVEWEIVGSLDGKQDSFLKDGWEPFAVAAIPSNPYGPSETIVWMRRKKVRP